MELLDDASTALARSGHHSRSEDVRVPSQPGLYAVHGGAEVLLAPPLSLSKVSTPWRRQVVAARQALARQARDWRPATSPPPDASPPPPPQT